MARQLKFIFSRGCSDGQNPSTRRRQKSDEIVYTEVNASKTILWCLAIAIKHNSRIIPAHASSFSCVCFRSATQCTVFEKDLAPNLIFHLKAIGIWKFSQWSCNILPEKSLSLMQLFPLTFGLQVCKTGQQSSLHVRVSSVTPFHQSSVFKTKTTQVECDS